MGVVITAARFLSERTGTVLVPIAASMLPPLLRLLLVFVLCWARPAWSQAWPQPEGGIYVKVSHGRAAAAEQLAFDGSIKPYAASVDGRAFFDRSTYAYAEAGVGPNVTLVAMVPVKHLRVLDAAYAYESTGLGSVVLGARVGLKPLLGVGAPRQALAINAAAILPTGYTRNLAPALGAGQADVQATLNWGLSLYPAPLYLQAGAGYRHRSDLYRLSRSRPCQPGRDIDCVADARPDYDDEWLLSAEGGASLGRWALLQVLGHAVLSVRAPDAASSFTASNPIPTRQRYAKVGVGMTLYPVSSLGVSIQAFRTPYGRNTIRSTDVFFGLEYSKR